MVVRSSAMVADGGFYDWYSGGCGADSLCAVYAFWDFSGTRLALLKASHQLLDSPWFAEHRSGSQLFGGLFAVGSRKVE
ncbi:hypothetical protein Pan181_41750 [Aeoliella mucimassa]|uniref:Uncharacterized protein n=1 Tax=Aeoliella mucimassa TaxID=2527972 RepID=A0A518ATA4_9BACT|nr:hypothetical protein Pan181_41750 [Aeoliella mucimassa]